MFGKSKSGTCIGRKRKSFIEKNGVPLFILIARMSQPYASSQSYRAGFGKERISAYEIMVSKPTTIVQSY